MAGNVGDEWVYLGSDTAGGVAVDVEHGWNSYADNSDEEDASSDGYSDYSNEGRLERAYESGEEDLDQVDQETDHAASDDMKKLLDRLLDDESDCAAFDLDMGKMLDKLSSIADRRKAARTPATDYGYGGSAYQDDLLRGPFSESLYGDGGYYGGNSGCGYGGGGCYCVRSNYYRGGGGHHGGGNGGLSDFDYGSGRDDGGLCDFDYGSGRGYYEGISEFDYGRPRGYHDGLSVFDYGSRRDYYGGMSDCGYYGYPHGPNVYLGGLRYPPFSPEAPEAELGSWT